MLDLSSADHTGVCSQQQCRSSSPVHTAMSKEGQTVSWEPQPRGRVGNPLAVGRRQSGDTALLSVGLHVFEIGISPRTAGRIPEMDSILV